MLRDVLTGLSVLLLWLVLAGWLHILAPEAGL